MISSEFTAGGFVTLGEKRFRLDYAESHTNKEIMYIPSPLVTIFATQQNNDSSCHKRFRLHYDRKKTEMTSIGEDWKS